jgi:hypothetical protein
MNRRTILLLGAGAFLSGCAGTLASIDTASAPRPVRSPTPSPVRTVVTPTSYRHGRFTVRRDPDGGQTIEGFAFLPPDEPLIDYRARSLASERQPHHLILVDFYSKELHYYVWDEVHMRWQPNLGFAILSPYHRSLPREVVVGQVTRIDLEPEWYPPESIRRDYRAAGRPLPARLPPGHPDNLMGAAKFIINWGGVLPATVRLHGAVGYPATPLHEVETYGCVSLLDMAILQLINRIKRGRPVSVAVAEGIVVAFHRRSFHLT